MLLVVLGHDKAHGLTYHNLHVTLARLCVTGSLINLVQLVSHAEGNGPSVL